MVRVLLLVAPAVSGKNGNRGVNGPELRTLNTIKHISPKKVSIIVSYSIKGRLWNKFIESKIPIEDFYVKSKFHWKSILTIISLINKYKINIIHTQGPASLDLFATIAAKRTNKLIIITRPVMIDDLQIRGFRRLLYKTVDKYTLKKADNIIAVSQTGYTYLVNQERIGEHNVRLVYNGVDLDRFENNHVSNKKRYGLLYGSLVVGACAQLTYVKGWEDFIEVVRILCSSIPKIQGLIVGDGPLRKQLERRVHSLDLQNKIKFTGHLDEVEAALKCMDLFLFMSKREGLSVAVIEAMACNLPCVITNAGGAQELVQNGLNGFVVPVGGVDNAAKKARKILMDKNLQKQMGKQSRLICEQKFTIEKMAGQYQKLYAELGRR